MRLTPQARRDRALQDHVETTHFYDEQTGKLYEPVEVPPDPDPDPEGED